MKDTIVRRALEEMKIAMHSRHGYSWDHEVGRVMRAVEGYVESRMGPRPTHVEVEKGEYERLLAVEKSYNILCEGIREEKDSE